MLSSLQPPLLHFNRCLATSYAGLRHVRLNLDVWLGNQGPVVTYLYAASLA
eukprot:m.35218 g.35218  ORF g.35218 m.35218 type:complete len:51 (+) comp12370_c1_seq13:778-930(+)